MVYYTALDGLDIVKKGTDNININSREAIRYFDRIQNGSLSVRGLSFQHPTEVFDNWKALEGYMVPGALLPGQQQRSPTVRPSTPISPSNKPADAFGFSPPRSPGAIRQNGNAGGGVKSPNGNTGNKGRSNTFPIQQNGRRYTNGNSDTTQATASVEPPRRIQQLLNCVLFRKHKIGKRDTSPPGHLQLAKRPEIHLVTNSPEVTAWARIFDINVLSSNVLEDMIEREEFIYAEKMKEYQEAQLQTETGRHGGRGGRGGGRGHRGGGGTRNGFSHGHSHNPKGHRGVPEPDFVFVREAPRGVARGKGKLWEP